MVSQILTCLVTNSLHLWLVVYCIFEWWYNIYGWHLYGCYSIYRKRWNLFSVYIKKCLSLSKMHQMASEQVTNFDDFSGKGCPRTRLQDKVSGSKMSTLQQTGEGISYKVSLVRAYPIWKRLQMRKPWSYKWVRRSERYDRETSYF